jgi:small-conductance mechanosensitive channel
MSAEQFTSEPRKDRARDVLIYFAVAVVAFGAGILVESQLAAQTAASAKIAQEQELKQAAAKADEDKRMLTDSLAKEREEHAKDIQSKDRHLASISSNAAGVRRDLEAGLSAARSSGDACTARITGISQALGSIFDSIGEVTGIAQDLGRENKQLKEDNKSLADKLAGWQKWNEENAQRITITGKKAS